MKESVGMSVCVCYAIDKVPEVLSVKLLLEEVSSLGRLFVGWSSGAGVVWSVEDDWPADSSVGTM